MHEPPRDVNQIDWESWVPTERATLCFIIRDGQVLLIHKKRGLGSGYMNGPGGRIEPGETALAAAIRETQEEIGVTPNGLEEIGQLFFQFLDGFRIHVTVFAASGCEGQLCETDEAKPQWTALDDIPYDRMWQDDPHWLPLLLSRNKFRGFFLFDDRRLLSYRVDR